MINYSLVIPCYNEEKTIKSILERTKNIFLNRNIELIIVNNGSTDNSKQIIESSIFDYPHAKFINIETNQGYGGGILEGLKHCEGEIIGWTHADLQTDPLDCINAFDIFKEKNKLAKIYIKGNRKKRPKYDQFFTFGMSVFETLLLRKLIYDVNAQPTIFPKTFFKSWKNPPNDFSLDLYSYYMAKRNNYSIIRFNVEFARRIYGISKWNINLFSKIKFILRTIKYSLKLSSNRVN